MDSKKGISLLFAVAALMFTSAIGFAHNGVEHVMGTVTAVTDTSITVDTVKHTAVTVTVDANTTFSHKETKASLKDVKIGERVVINAKEGADKKLLGISVKWGASSGTTTSHADHKM